MTEMLNAVRDALGNLHFLYLYGAALLFLLIFFRNNRKAFLIPVVLMTAAVLNPVFFRLWNKINDYAYWRTLWMIPIVPVCAAVPAFLVEKAGSQDKRSRVLVKVGIVVAAAAVFVVAGTWIGSNSLTRFSAAQNAEKLPAGVPVVGDALLELDDTPYVAADNEICIYLRQYSGYIHPMFGRDVYFGISGPIAAEAFHELTAGDGDLHRAAQLMLDNGYEYLVSKTGDDQRQNKIVEAGFEPVRELDGYNIYRVTGKPSVVQTYNELHQVTARTFVDENGDPVNGPDGYTTETYEYDKMGRVIRMFREDISGNGVADAEGKAGYERNYNRRWGLTREVWLGADGNPVNIEGYAIRTITYKGKKTEEERYYNADGTPASIGPGFSKCRFDYTDEGALSLVWYLDEDDQPVEAGSAYFHEYLQSLKGRDISIFVSAKDDASSSMTVTLWEDMKELGIQTDLRGQFRKSFYAVVSPEDIQEEVGDEELSCSGLIGDIPYTVKSAGLESGNYSSIQIGGQEFSWNARGLNIVIFDNVQKEIVESTVFDTFAQAMPVKRRIP